MFVNVSGWRSTNHSCSQPTNRRPKVHRSTAHNQHNGDTNTLVGNCRCRYLHPTTAEQLTAHGSSGIHGALPSAEPALCDHDPRDHLIWIHRCTRPRTCKRINDLIGKAIVPARRQLIMRRPPGGMRISQRATLLTSLVAFATVWTIYKSQFKGPKGQATVLQPHTIRLGASSSSQHKSQDTAVPQVEMPIWWMAPFMDFSSFGTEATDIITTLVNSGVSKASNTRIGLLQMECNDEVQGSLDPQVHALLVQLKTTELPAPAVVVCHNMPKFYGLPSPAWKSCEPCPPKQYKSAYTIARAMAETTRVPGDFTSAINSLDEVWVPCEYSKQALIGSGVTASKVHIVPPVVNTTMFDPALYQATALEHTLPFTKVYGLRRGAQDKQHVFTFTSVFKWEQRKGWDVLLSAFLSEFTWNDHVALYIVTRPFDQVKDMKEEIMQWVSKHMPNTRPVSMPHLYVCTERLSNTQYGQLLASSDAFVLPTRGEGFGLPMVEAMSMGVPVVATQYSGVAAYLDSTCGYPVPFKEVDVPADVKQPWFKGQWAEPDVSKLKQILRHVTRNPDEAKARGAAARERILDWYSPQASSVKLGHEFKRIERLLAAARKPAAKPPASDA